MHLKFWVSALPRFCVFLSISPIQLTVTLGHGQLGHLALSHADWEAKLGQGKNNVTSSTFKVLLFFIFYSQGKHWRCKKQWGKVCKAQDNWAWRNRHMQCDLQSPYPCPCPWYGYEGKGMKRRFRIACFQLTVMLGHGKLGHLALSHADWEAKIGPGKNNFISSTFEVLVVLYLYSQGKHWRCKKQWGEVCKAEDNWAWRNRHLQCDL